MPCEDLGETTLKNGESVRLAVAVGPARQWQRPLCAFLNSPPRPDGPSLYTFLLTEDVPGLQTRFFFARSWVGDAVHSLPPGPGLQAGGEPPG